MLGVALLYNSYLMTARLGDVGHNEHAAVLAIAAAAASNIADI